MMKKFAISALLAAVALTLAGGCATHRLPSEDIEVLTLYAEDIAILKNPDLPANSREKYEAAKRLTKNVDFSFTRGVDTVESIFLPQDALINRPGDADRDIVFLYQYGDKYVRFEFGLYKDIVLSRNVIEK